MFPGAVLHVGVQFGRVCVWVLVDPEKPPVERAFSMRGTGHQCPYTTEQYLGTVVLEDGGLVLHVFVSSHAPEGV
jgi:hypothetical protein